MSQIIRCDHCGYEKDKNNPIFGPTGKDWQTLWKDGFTYDLCTMDCLIAYANKVKQDAIER